MRLAFVDPGPLRYDLDSPGKIPLGGSESALCYLTSALSAAGHQVYFLKEGATAHWCQGVRCLPLTPHMLREICPVEAVVVLNVAGVGAGIRETIGPRVPLVLWNQQAPDQPDLQPLKHPAVRNAYTGFACVSEWQARVSTPVFGWDPRRIGIQRNAVAPWFLNLFSAEESILAAKDDPPVLAYTSTPYRGLDLLLDIFPRVRREFADVRLQVFSSMRVYQMQSEKEAAYFGALYDRCRNTPGVESCGSVSQTELARALRAVSLFTYSNTYAETSCISVMEALAAGCGVITSHLAALPETAGGYADLIPLESDADRQQYVDRFAIQVIERLGEQRDENRRAAREEALRRQLTYIHTECTWHRRAQQWVDWLSR